MRQQCASTVCCSIAWIALREESTLGTPSERVARVQGLEMLAFGTAKQLRARIRGQPPYSHKNPYLVLPVHKQTQPPEGPRVAINTRHLCRDANDGPGAPRHMAPGPQNAACQGRFA